MDTHLAAEVVQVEAHRILVLVLYVRPMHLVFVLDTRAGVLDTRAADEMVWFRAPQVDMLSRVKRCKIGFIIV